MSISTFTTLSTPTIFSTIITVFFPLIHEFFFQLAVRFDHIGNEGENGELNAEEYTDRGKNDVVLIGSDFEFLKVVKSEEDESDKAEADEK